MRSLCIDSSGALQVRLVEDGRILAGAVETNPRRQAEAIGAHVQSVIRDASALNPQASDIPQDTALLREVNRSTLEPTASTSEPPPSARDAGIERIIVGTGPGPFTGLRAGIAFAMTMGRGLQVPVLGVSSQEGLARLALDCLAGTAPAGLADRVDLPDGVNRAGSVLVLGDAKRREVYWGIYEANGSDDVAVISGPNVGPPSDAIEAGLAHGVAAVAGASAVLDSVGVGHAWSQSGTGEPGTIALEIDPWVFERIVDARPGAEFALEPLYLRQPDIHGQPSQLL